MVTFMCPGVFAFWLFFEYLLGDTPLARVGGGVGDANNHNYMNITLRFAPITYFTL